MSRIVVITGASSGIGLATAKLFVSKGDKVYCLSRTRPNEQGIEFIQCDVSDENSVSLAFSVIQNNEGRIDVLILNAGYGISGAVESTSSEQAKKQFDVNFFGTVRCVKNAAPLMRNSPLGNRKMIFMSSLAALIPIPFQSFYSASKAAVCSVARCVSAEMRPFGIKVACVCPGDVKTGFTDSRRKNDENALYRGHAEKAVKTMEKDERQGMSPEKIAYLVYKLSNKRRLKPYYTAGLGYKALLLLSRIMPPSLVDYIVRKIYT